MSRYHSISEQFYGNRLLFGDPADAGVVAVEIASRSEVEVFKLRKGADGREIVRERRPLKLFILIADRSLLDGFPAAHEIIDLAGDFHFRHAAMFDSTDAFEAARRHLRMTSGKAGGAVDAPWFPLPHPVQQHLMLTGTTFFMGLQFGDLRRMQIDLETYISPGFEFPT